MLTTVLYANPVVRLTPLKLLPSRLCLQDLPNLFWRHLTMVVQGVKPFIERLLAQRTEVPLATVRGFAMFMSAGVTAESTFHKSY